MFLKPNPPGVNRPQDCDRMHIVKVTSGDAWRVDARLYNPSNGVPASYMNTNVRFVLSENKFNRMPIWVGEWSRGVFLDAVIPGLVHVIVPECVCNTLRRGTYAFSIVVSDIDGKNTRTQLSGYFEVEYEPSSEQHDIPYRDDDGKSTTRRCIGCLSPERREELIGILERSIADENPENNDIKSLIRAIADFLIEGRNDDCGCDDDTDQGDDGGSSDTPDDGGDPDSDDRDAIVNELSGIAGSMAQLVDALKDSLAHEPCGCRTHRRRRPPGYKYPSEWGK